MEIRSSKKGPQPFNAVKQATPVNENDSFVDFKPDIYEEELNEIVVYKDKHAIKTYNLHIHWLTQTKRRLATLPFILISFACPTSFIICLRAVC